MKIIKHIRNVTIGVSLGLCVLYFFLTGSPFPKRIVEKLNNPLQVKEVTSNGIVTTNGDMVKVKYVAEIPTESPIIQAAVENGIEVGDNGETFGLLKIWHWCGNDPVRYHIARVNLTNVIIASGGKPDRELPKKLWTEDVDLDFGEHGLNISDFYRIRHISDYIEMETEPSPGDHSLTAAPQE